MKRNVVILMFLGLMISGFAAYSQEGVVTLSLSVDEAVQYALDNNRSIASARYDLLASEKSYKETLASGLPSVDGSASFTDNLKLVTTLLPGEFLGLPGEKVAVTFGSTFNSAYGVSASTAIFNAPWLIGVRTAKLASTLAEQGLEQTEIDTKESVMTAYYLILVSTETIKVIDANLANLNEILASTKAMYSVGMAEATDVDQMQSSVSMLQNTKATMERSLEVSYNLMRFLLGVDRSTQLVFTEALDSIVSEIRIEDLLAEEFNIKENVSYKLIESQLMMSELSLKGARASALPSLAGNIYYNNSGMADALNDLQWFSSSAVTLQLSIPIFASGSRHSKIQKARINLDKAVNTRDMVSDQLLMQEKQLRFNLQSAEEQYRLQKENIEIAERVLTSFRNKYNQGMASSLDLTQANNNYLTAENNYLSALMNLLQTKVEFDKLMNNL